MSKKSYPSKRINGIKKRIHRHVMEEKIGRLLSSAEHVYHLNGDPNDYSLENLVVIVKNLTKEKL